MVGYPSGQRGQTVNLLAYAFSGSNPEPTTTLFHGKTRVLFNYNEGLVKSPVLNVRAWLLLHSLAFAADKATIKQPNLN